MGRVSRSLSICLLVVPEPTKPWKPDTAPQAMVMNRKGNHDSAPLGLGTKAGAWTSGW